MELLHKGKNGTMHAGETRVAGGEKGLEETTKMLKNTETRYAMLGANFPMGLKTADVVNDMFDTILDHLKAGGGHGEFTECATMVEAVQLGMEKAKQIAKLGDVAVGLMAVQGGKVGWTAGFSLLRGKDSPAVHRVREQKGQAHDRAGRER